MIRVKELTQHMDIIPQIWLQVRHFDEGLTLETSASLSLHGENLNIINLFDTKF